MGGAERAERKRKQQAAKAVTAARSSSGGSGNRGTIVAVVVVVLLALVVGGGIWLQSRSEPEALPPAIPPAAPGVDFPVRVDGDAVIAGNPDAPVTVDVYEDFLCPVCGQFEQIYGEPLEQAAADGRAKVVYHPIAILDRLSEPPGYSSLAAGGALCAAEAGIFPRFHDSLYQHQPKEGAAGWTREQIEELGRSLGAGDPFAQCLGDAEQRATGVTERASQYLATLRPDGRVGTPTIVVNGQVADLGDPQWLDKALAAGN